MTIAVFGEALIDVFGADEVLGGAPFNVARNLAAFGARPLMITRIGNDVRGERIAEAFERHGMDARALQRDPRYPTGSVTVSVLDGEPHFEIHADAAWDHLSAAGFLPTLHASKPGIVYFGTLAQRAEGSRRAIREGLLATHALRFLDLNLRGLDDQQGLSQASMQLADIVKVNAAELALLLEWFVDRRVAATADGECEAIAGLMQRFELQRLVVTRGEQGWSCFEGNTVLEGRAVATTVLDTVGAGDAFASVLLLGELRGWPVAQSLLRASQFASMVCGVRGGFIGSDAIATLGWK